MMKRLVHIQPFAAPIAEKILRAEPDIELVQVHLTDPDSVYWGALESALGLQAPSANYVGSERLKKGFVGSDEVVERCPNLLAMNVQGAGYDTVDVDACTAGGVIVLNQTGLGKESVVEHALAMIISLSKQMIQADKRLRRDRDGWTRLEYKGTDIHGKTIGIIGLGNIGTYMARTCRTAFRMRTLAYDPYLSPEDFRERGAEQRSLEDLLRQSDYVTIHVPFTTETAGLIGERELRLMQKHAFLIVTARGGIVDEDALNRVLRDKAIAGAGLDVWRPEPPDLDNPLLALDNVFATPHNAGCSYESYEALAEGAALQWVDLFHGRKPPRIVNPEAWPRCRERASRILGVELPA